MSKLHADYNFHSRCYVQSDCFIVPDNVELWDTCIGCGLKPKVWRFDNGCYTGCGCHNDAYDYFSVRAESIRSHISRCDGSVVEYDCDALRKNWNHYCSTGELVWGNDYKLTGRW